MNELLTGQDVWAPTCTSDPNAGSLIPKPQGAVSGHPAPRTPGCWQAAATEIAGKPAHTTSFLQRRGHRHPLSASRPRFRSERGWDCRPRQRLGRGDRILHRLKWEGFFLRRNKLTGRMTLSRFCAFFPVPPQLSLACRTF